MNRKVIQLLAISTLLGLGQAGASVLWSTVNLNTFAGLDVNTGIGIPTRIGTFGVETGVSATFNQISLAQNAQNLTQDDLLKDRTMLDGAEVRLGIVAREIPLRSKTGKPSRVQAYVGGGVAYQFKHLYEVYDDIQSGKINMNGTDPNSTAGQQKAVQFAKERIQSDMNPYFEAGVMGKFAGPIGWKAGFKLSDSISAGVGLELRF